MKVIGARFKGTTTLYAYYVPEGDNPKVGDVILTSVSWDTKTIVEIGMEDEEDATPQALRNMVLGEAKLATVVTLNLPYHHAQKATKFYVMLIPLDHLHEAQKRNREMLTHEKRRKEIMALLDDKLRSQNRMELYARLASSDPEAAALLQELQGNTIEHQPATYEGVQDLPEGYPARKAFLDPQAEARTEHAAAVQEAQKAADANEVRAAYAKGVQSATFGVEPKPWVLGEDDPRDPDDPRPQKRRL